MTDLPGGKDQPAEAVNEDRNVCRVPEAAQDGDAEEVSCAGIGGLARRWRSTQPVSPASSSALKHNAQSARVVLPRHMGGLVTL